MNISDKIRAELDLPISDDLSIYKDLENRSLYAPKIAEIVNKNVPQINAEYDAKVLEEIHRDGYSVVENFLSQDEVNHIKDYIKNIKGYQFHVPNRAFNKVPQLYDENLDWNICSYKMNHLLTNHFILNMVTRPDVVALAQAYLGCLPTITSVSMWWSKYTGQEFHTQKVHRDYDDFRFLAFFIYLTDVDENNGPHVYYKNTHNGSDDMSEKVVIKGKAGTAIFGDTYALHHGNPLSEGERLLFWSRYTLHKNNNFYRDEDTEYELSPNLFFDIVEDNEINRHLLHAFTR